MVMMVTLVMMTAMRMNSLSRFLGRELQLALVGFPAEVKRRIGEAVTAATQFTAQKSAAEPKQDMSSSAFLCYHTESDWRRVNTAGTTEGKVAVFVSRAARIGLTSPTDDYLRKVRGCVRVCECARDCVCACVCGVMRGLQPDVAKVCAAVCVASGFSDGSDFRKVVKEVRSQWKGIKKWPIREGCAASARHHHCQHHHGCCSTAIINHSMHHAAA